MSSTRKSKDSTSFHQNRYASSPEFERGLLGNLVAKRAALLGAGSDRELVWFIQYLSHRDGGIAGFASELIKSNPDKIQTSEMAAMKLKPGKICNADQVQKIRSRLPEVNQHEFLLKGEVWSQGGPVKVTAASDDWEDGVSKSELAEAERRPPSYEANRFFELCLNEAESNLEKDLSEICLDPGSSLSEGPWYFHSLIDVMREYQSSHTKSKASVFTTALGEKVCEILDYTSFSRGLTLMQGEARTGKSFAARTWCEQRPGVARFVEVPPGNDEVGFFRALARGLGLGNLLRYKSCDIRDRVESVLLTGDLLLVLDEAQRLWPQMNLRYGFPSRVVWTMAMANAGAAIAMVSTPQFIQAQKAIEKTGWNSAQLTGRIKHYESLPPELSGEDLFEVAKSVLPEASSEVLKVLAIYAKTSARHLAAIETISTRARYIAMKSTRDRVTTEDVRTAMQESVIPADTKLHLALERSAKEKRIKPVPQPPLISTRENTVTQPPDFSTPIRESNCHPRTAQTPFVESEG